jgi:exosortase
MPSWTGALLLIAPLVAAYAVALRWMVDRWWMDWEQYGHVVLLPIVAVWAIRVRGRLPAARVARGIGPWLLLGPGLALHAVGTGLTVDSVSALSLALTAPGVVWLLFGAARVRALAPVLGLLPFAIPLPLFLVGRIVFELKEMAIGGGLALAHTLGVGVARDGVHLQVDGASAPLVVADACSGLQSLLALTTLGYCFAYLWPGRRAWWRRLIALALAVPFAVFGNMWRVAAMCAMAAWFDTPFATGLGHDITNALTWVGVLGALIGVDAALGRLDRAVSVSGGGGESEDDDGRARTVRVDPARDVLAGWRVSTTALLVVWIMGPLLAIGSFYRPFTPSRALAVQLPERVAGYDAIETYRLTPRHQQLLGTDDAVWRRYRPRDPLDEKAGATSDASSDVFLVGVFHGTNWKSVHPPQLCLRGTNMTLLDDTIWSGRPDADDELVEFGYIRAVSNDASFGGRNYVSLYAFGGGDWRSASYATFLARHALRATIRASTDGFLLRVETWQRDDESLDDATLRCARLLDALVQDSRKLAAAEHTPR